jgi:hypothetical protein
VKVAASIDVCFNARRQSSELLANAIMASAVKTKTFPLVILSEVEGPLILPLLMTRRSRKARLEILRQAQDDNWAKRGRDS